MITYKLVIRGNIKNEKRSWLKTYFITTQVDYVTYLRVLMIAVLFVVLKI